MVPRGTGVPIAGVLPRVGWIGVAVRETTGWLGVEVRGTAGVAGRSGMRSVPRASGGVPGRGGGVDGRAGPGVGARITGITPLTFASVITGMPPLCMLRLPTPSCLSIWS